jgi:hypothetical protein
MRRVLPRPTALVISPAVVPVARNPCARSGILIADGVFAEPFVCTAFVVSGVVD